MITRKKSHVFLINGLFLITSAFPLILMAQTTSWIGGTNTRWRTASNWTSGVPNETTDVIIGDANFTGPNQPELRNGSGGGECNSLTVGNGSISSTLTIHDGIDIHGTITIGSMGIVDDDGGRMTISGDWINSGSYNASGSNRRVYFDGATQIIGGTSVTDFERLYINSSSMVTLAQNVITSNFISLSGILNPVNFQVTGTGDIDIETGGVLKVMASTLAGNYANSGSIDSNTNSSVVDYAATSINQSISNSISYRDLTISGAMTKSLVGNTTIQSDLSIDGGTMDLGGFTANHSSSGGSLTIASGATLKIGGTNSFPSNYTSHTLATTSTVEYSGGNQSVSNEIYGNLTLSSTSGTITKTMPGTALTVARDFTTSVTGGTLGFTAGNNITVLGNITLGSSTTFNGSTFTHSTNGNWTNNGTFNGCGGSFNFNGSTSLISGFGTNNFGNVIINGSGTILHENTSLSLCGNFSTTGGGSFTQTPGGTGNFTMTTASSSSISGSNIIFNNLITSGAGTISTSSSFTIAGNLTANGTLTASAGTILFSGSGKTISGTASIQLNALTITGSLSTARDLLLSSNLNVLGSFTATAGQITFNGTSTLSGTANIFDIRITSSGTLLMGSNSILGIAATVTFDGGGVFNATANVPNTVNYNSSSGAQSLVFPTFDNLIVSGGNTKTPPSALTINGNFTIGSSTTFDGSTYTHNLSGNWVNNGTFTMGTSTIQLTGNNDVSLTGATTFNNLTVNKGASNKVTMINNMNVDNLAMTSGSMRTGSNTLTITSSRTGNGIIIGTITRTHSYTTGINYDFEGPNNFINFSSITGTITSITMVVSSGANVLFPSAASANRTYNITVTGASAHLATLRLHYEQVELNGNVETEMTIWNYGGSLPWSDNGKNTNDATDNWLDITGVSALTDLWTLSEGVIKYSWNGSASTDWSGTSNWTPNGTPTSVDVVHIGDLSFTNQPTLSTSSNIKKIYFQSTTPSTLTLGSGGDLTVQGNIDGLWSGDAVHTIDVGSQTLVTLSNIVLSNGVSNQKIDIQASTGLIDIAGSLTQSAGADITFSDAASLNIGGDFNYVSGSFTPSTSTVTLNGTDDQQVGGVTFYNLDIDKASGTALINASTTVNNDLNISTGGQTDVNSTLTVAGNIDIGTSTTLNFPGSTTLNISGNWIQSGTFIPGSGTVVFNGTGSQTTVATTYNNITINKASGTFSLLGDLTINGNVDIQSGTVEVSTFDVNRSTLGGIASLGAGATTLFGGSSVQISNFSDLIADPTSTIEYYTSSPRVILPITYGNLILSNGGANAKTMIGPTTVAGNLTVNSGATLTAPSTTLTLEGDFTMDGTFNPSTGTVVYAGTSNINGSITYNDIVTSGTVDMVNGDATINGDFVVTATGDFDAGNNTIVSFGDVTNSGILSSSGTTTFSGTQVQTIRLINAVSSASTGVINFNGTVSPILNSTSSPTFATVNINNTAPITASQSWTVAVAINVDASATWNGGALDHFFLRHFTNNGIVTSSGILSFLPTATTANVDLGTNFSSTGTVNFGGNQQINLSQATGAFESVTISNTNGAGITPAIGWDISQDMLITAGAQLNGGALSHTISGEWNNNGTFDGQSSTVTFNSTVGTDAILGSGTNNFHNLVFDTNTSMDIIADISASGNFTNDATALQMIDQAVSFTGSGLSVLNGGTTTIFDDLELNKSSNNLQLNTNATVAGSLILTDGVLDLNTNTLMLSNPDAGAVSRTNGYILSENTSFNSSVAWAIGTDVTEHSFPFGNASGDYIPFVFELNSGDAGLVTVATYGTGADNLPWPPGITGLNDESGNENSENTVDRFYNINLSGESSPDADITFNASAVEVGTISTLQGQKWSGGWQAPLPGQTPGATSVMIPGVTSFSTWAISGNSSPLPVELLHFSAIQIEDGVLVEWETASELNNDYFEVYKSLNGKDFYSIYKTDGAGTTSAHNSYSFKDFNLSRNGLVYYYLKQVDYDGTSTKSYTVIVDVNKIGLPLTVYPNPASDILYLHLDKEFTGDINTELYDALGNMIVRRLITNNESHKESEINVDGLSPGIYILKVYSRSISKSVKVLIN
ncbi:T9SS type A sorting domain-containing protein [Reichenbachiella sp. MALMAid0571]|uniref:T9SS type A sorting domain-containing protein n=1 Tax=Reichenbachiella sp. MALMAid0571 TaxID=3143939 RepID=UPI0032DE75B0